MKKKLTRMLLLLALMSFTANNTYSYNALGKILKPKSEEETSNRGKSILFLNILWFSDIKKDKLHIISHVSFLVI